MGSDNVWADSWDMAMSQIPQDKTALSWASFVPMVFRKLATPKVPTKPLGFGETMLFSPYVMELIQREGIEAAKCITNDAKNKIENEANGIMRQITYPEGLINEAVNRHISKGKR